jgi:RNA polymerase sigma factor (sigma-70 family)
MVQEVEERDLLEAAFSILQRLPAKQRIAFVLRYVEGESLERIAELSEVSVGTVKRRLRLATKRFEQRVCAHPDLLARLETRTRDKRRDR